MLKARLLALASVAALLAACSGGGQRTIPSSGALQPAAADREITTLSTFVARDNATGTLLKIFPTREIIDTIRADAAHARSILSTSNLLYNGGPIQTAPHLYVVFWGSAWNPGGGGDPDGVAAQLTKFYGVIGGSKWLNTVTQYYQSSGQYVGNAGTIFASTSSSWVDTSTPPSRPRQWQLAAEAAKAAFYFGDYSANAGYVVALPHGVHPSGFGTQYCAYHTTTSANGAKIAWTNLPYIPDAGYACGAGSVNSPGTLDGVTIVSGHEEAETETDPQPNTGWLDSSGAEIGDKCAWTGLIDNPDASNYPTQPLWSNASSSCVQSY